MHVGGSRKHVCRKHECREGDNAVHGMAWKVNDEQLVMAYVSNRVTTVIGRQAGRQTCSSSRRVKASGREETKREESSSGTNLWRSRER